MSGVSPNDSITLHLPMTFRKLRTISATSSGIADRMLPELGGPRYQRLVVVMPGEVSVFGHGEAISNLARYLPRFVVGR